MFVLGLDPGLATTGYGVVDGSSTRPKAVAAGAISTDGAAPMAARLAELYEDLSNIIAEYRPSVVAVEQVFTNKNLKTSIAVGRASGVILLAAANASLEVFEYTPSAIKAAVTGHGAAPKDQMTKVIELRLGVTASPVDAVDALAAALCHLQSHRLQAAR